MAGDMAAEDEEEEEVAAPTPIELDCGSFTVAVTSWEQLAEAQMQHEAAQLTPTDFEAKAGEHAVFAFCYEEEVVDPWQHI